MCIRDRLTYVSNPTRQIEAITPHNMPKHITIRSPSPLSFHYSHEHLDGTTYTVCCVHMVATLYTAASARVCTTSARVCTTSARVCSSAPRLHRVCTYLHVSARSRRFKKQVTCRQAHTASIRTLPVLTALTDIDGGGPATTPTI